MYNVTIMEEGEMNMDMVIQVMPNVGDVMSVRQYLSTAASSYCGPFARQRALGSLGGAVNGGTVMFCNETSLYTWNDVLDAFENWGRENNK